MEILINNLPAALKKGTSFQFITENRYFTGSDSYTLAITFPLRGCTQNLRIFGHIGRMDVSKEVLRFDCEIRDGAFCRFGTITVTSITPEEVKTQFLEGRSEQNFADDFDKVYINELDLGQPDTSVAQTPSERWRCPSSRSYVALPWVNNASGNIQNLAVYDETKNAFAWHADTKVLSCQPYLTYMIRKVAEAVGYSIDITAIEESPYGCLLVCNALPSAWYMPEFASALPHWSITEFLEELEKLLNGVFTVDHRARSISFSFNVPYLQSLSPVEIKRVLAGYSTEISKDEAQCEYQEACNVRYADAGHEMWKFCDCPWLIETFRNRKESASGEKWVAEYDTFRQLHEEAVKIKDDTPTTTTTGRGVSVLSATARLMYARDIDTYFTHYTLWYEEAKNGLNQVSSFMFHSCLLPLNVFGERIVRKDNEASMELKIVPAWIQYTDTVYGDILCLDCGTKDTGDDAVMVEGSRAGRAYLQPHVVRVCQSGDEAKSVEYLDKLYVGFYEGFYPASVKSYLPRPFLDALDIRADWSYRYDSRYNLRLNSDSLQAPRRRLFSINTEQKFTFSFLADDIPDVHTLFYIEGHRYICEKIASTFSESGMSQLQKGTFYEVLEVCTEWPQIDMK